jgi:hypothetical protein
MALPSIVVAPDPASTGCSNKLLLLILPPHGQPAVPFDDRRARQSPMGWQPAEVRDVRWAGVPDGVRRAVFVTSAVFVYGTVVHVGQLIVGGWDPYPSVPGWLAVYFVSLTVLDPLAAGLLLLRRRAGLVLGGAVLVTDAAANGFANYVIDASAGLTAGRVGHAVITLSAVALLLATPRLWPHLRPLSRH